ncbi:MAG: hypothetical protein WBD53_01690, partial [Xanthobacteraceae bacterium]
VEIALYAFYGLVLATGREAIVYFACGASIVAGIAIASANLTEPNLYNWWENSSLVAFIPYWWLGAAAVVPQVRSWLLRWWPGLIAAWLILTLASYPEPTAVAAEIRKLVLAGLVATLVIVVDRMAIAANPLSFVGKAGYSIYALHAPVVVALLILGVPWWAAALAAIAGGMISFFAFERPLDQRGRRIAAGIRGASSPASPQPGGGAVSVSSRD